MTAHGDGDLRWLGALICLASAALMIALLIAGWRWLA
jgi:hypothetical protein